MMDFGQSIDSSSRGNIVIPSTSAAFRNNASSTSTSGIKSQASHSFEKIGSSLRRLKTVLVIDKKVQKFLKVREMACQDIEAVSSALNVNLQLIDFDRLDFGESSTLDNFYNADIALIDFSITHQQPSLCYHVGVRESMGQTYNIIIMCCSPPDIPDDQKCEMQIEALKRTLTQCSLIVYFLSKEDVGSTLAPVLLSADRSSKLGCFTSNSQRQELKYQKMLKKGRSDSFGTFADRIKQVLNNVTIEANAHAREKFLSDLRKVRDIDSHKEQCKFLERMRTRLDNPDVLSVDTVHQFLLCLRDTQDYDGIISMIDDLERIDQKQITHAQAVRFLYAFALNRRNKNGDRDKALTTVEQIMDSSDYQMISPDVICLAGRVYKDKFISSGYEDKQALDKAIEWYRKAFNLSPLEYSGINLTTMLRARGDTFENSPELQQIGLVLNSLLGRKGALANLTDYWDVATFFEVSVLAEDYNKACQAAEKMAMLKPPVWFLKSTLENIKLINRCTAKLQLSPVERDKKTFLFWTEFFMEAIDSQKPPINQSKKRENTSMDDDVEDEDDETTEDELSSSSTRFPVLIQELNKTLTPSYLNVNRDNIILYHVLKEDSNKKHVDLNLCDGVHRWEFKANNIKAVSASKRDDRSMFLYVYENSDFFSLMFPSGTHCQRFIMITQVQLRNLPAELIFKIFKILKFADLFSVKQTNQYFYSFINKYEDELSRKKFKMLFVTSSIFSTLKIRSIRSEGYIMKYNHKTINFPLSDHLQDKWRFAVNKQIPIFIKNGRTTLLGKMEPVLLIKEENSQKKICYILKLPLYPNNIEEFKIVRYWFEQIFICDFDVISFDYYIFNPEMIKLLFNNEEIAKFKCSCKQVILSFNNKNIDDWKFIFNNLIIINERLLICTVSITEEDSNILLHLFLNEGDKIPSVALTELSNNQITLYNNLIKCIETSTDLSRIVNKIIFYCEGWNRSDLTIRGEMGENNNTKKCYKITNKHDSKMMFEITWIFEENENDLIESVSVILV